ncbi:MAG: thiol-disulfide oxidoreductase [Povalibacter sp.]
MREVAHRSFIPSWRSLLPASAAERATYDGLTAFAPIWAIASLFSIAGDRSDILFRGGLFPSAVTWVTVFAAVLLILRPRATSLLIALSALMLTRYAIHMPVPSNNKMISAFMNAGVLIIAAQAYFTLQPGQVVREVLYERMRVVGRALLAVMYFYGTFHKINTDFLDPNVSCAVALYTPLASGFGLGDNLVGKYLAIWSTFIVETITLVALYWKRYFAVGLLLGLMFHFVIPISAYSWYMDFSSLVLALYILSVPREVSAEFYASCARLFRGLRARLGDMGALLPFTVVVGMAALLVLALRHFNPQVAAAPFQLWQSVWVLLWVVYGGIAMVLLVNAALDHLPWRGNHPPRQPLWLYAIPLTLFLWSASPYVGLRTEGTIAMFSNLHTEGGVTNHLVIRQPVELFDYQRDVAIIRASSDPALQHLADRGNQGLVMQSLETYLRKNPTQWVTYDLHNVRHEKVTAASTDLPAPPNWWERTFLIFKPVDFNRPKVCTH